MGYRKYDIPVAFGRLVNDGKDFLGVQITGGRGNYVLYNLENGMVQRNFGQSNVDYVNALDVEDLQLPQGISANGAYFFTDYAYEYDDDVCEVTGCSVEVFDRETGERVTHIDISLLYDDWEDDCLIQEAAKLDASKYFFVYYDHEEDGWDSFEGCIYDEQTKKAYIVDGMEAEDGFFTDMHFNVDTLKLELNYVDSEAMHLRGRDVWQKRTYQLSSDYKSLDDINDHDDFFFVPFEDEDEGKKVWRRTYEAGFTVETAKKGLFGKEEVMFKDNRSGKILCNTEVSKTTSYWFEFLVEKNLLIVGVDDHKAESQKVSIFEKGIGGYELTEEMDVPYEAEAEYDECHQAVLLKTEQKTLIIK